MTLQVRDLTGELSDAAIEQAERRLQFALSRFASKISRAELIIDDENGPKGGVDSSCRIQVSLKGLPDVVITDKDANVSACIARVAERAQRSVARAVARNRQIDRKRLTTTAVSDPETQT